MTPIARTSMVDLNREEMARFIDHPSGFLALNSNNKLFTHPDVPGFIAFREQGRHMIGFGGVHAPIETRAALLDGFIEEADRRRKRLLFVQLRKQQVALFQERGATVNQLGSSFGIKLEGYSFSGTSKMKLRNKIKRAKKAGLEVSEIGRELPRDRGSFDKLETISKEWLAAKKKKELDFMIGEVGGPEDSERRIFLVTDKSEKPSGFITYVPVWGERPGYLHDLTRRLPHAPVGAMELCNEFAMNRMIAERVPYLHFGFTPFIVNEEEFPSASKTMAWLVRMLRKYGKIVYPAESQASYKLKWGNDILDPEYIAARPLSLRAAFDLLMVTRSI